MKRIGVRELRQNASEHLRLVQQGESIEITDRGRPIAMLVPVVNESSQVELLARQGRLSAATDDVLELGSPLPPTPGRATVTDELARMREDER